MTDELGRAIVEQLVAIRRELTAIRAANSPKVTIEQAAALLACSRTTVFDLLKTGSLTRTSGVGKEVMVTTASVQRLQREGLPQWPQQRSSTATRATEPTDAELDALARR